MANADKIGHKHTNAYCTRREVMCGGGGAPLYGPGGVLYTHRMMFTANLCQDPEYVRKPIAPPVNFNKLKREADWGLKQPQRRLTQCRQSGIWTPTENRKYTNFNTQTLLNPEPFGVTEAYPEKRRHVATYNGGSMFCPRSHRVTKEGKRRNTLGGSRDIPQYHVTAAGQIRPVEEEVVAPGRNTVGSMHPMRSPLMAKRSSIDGAAAGMASGMSSTRRFQSGTPGIVDDLDGRVHQHHHMRYSASEGSSRSSAITSQHCGSGVSTATPLSSAFTVASGGFKPISLVQLKPKTQPWDITPAVNRSIPVKHGYRKTSKTHYHTFTGGFGHNGGEPNCAHFCNQGSQFEAAY